MLEQLKRIIKQNKQQQMKIEKIEIYDDYVKVYLDIKENISTLQYAILLSESDIKRLLKVFIEKTKGED